MRPDELAVLSDGATFVPFHDVQGRPHIVVDGPATAGTVLGLSHWPDGRVPDDLAADTSAGIVVRYLERGATGPAVDIVTNNHFDEDGILAAWLLLERPGPDQQAAAVAAAEAGDFRTWTDPRAAWTALAIMAAAERATSPFPDVLRALNAARDHDPAGSVTIALLPRVPSLLDEPERYRRLWEPAWARVERDIATLDRAPDALVEFPEADLAVVRADRLLDPLAVFPRTGAMRVLWAVEGGWFRLEHRYETWVRYASRALPRRRDLAPLLPTLQRSETAPGAWVFEGVSSPQARLGFVGTDGAPAPSGIDVEHFVRTLTGFLTGPADSS